MVGKLCLWIKIVRRLNGFSSLCSAEALAANHDGNKPLTQHSLCLRQHSKCLLYSNSLRHQTTIRELLSLFYRMRALDYCIDTTGAQYIFCEWKNKPNSNPLLYFSFCSEWRLILPHSWTSFTVSITDLFFKTGRTTLTKIEKNRTLWLI